MANIFIMLQLKDLIGFSLAALSIIIALITIDNSYGLISVIILTIALCYSLIRIYQLNLKLRKRNHHIGKTQLDILNRISKKGNLNRKLSIKESITQIHISGKDGFIKDNLKGICNSNKGIDGMILAIYSDNIKANRKHLNLKCTNSNDKPLNHKIIDEDDKMIIVHIRFSKYLFKSDHFNLQIEYVLKDSFNEQEDFWVNKAIVNHKLFCRYPIDIYKVQLSFDEQSIDSISLWDGTYGNKVTFIQDIYREGNVYSHLIKKLYQSKDFVYTYKRVQSITNQ